jgi:rhodanese-related sulfurtransferase
MNAENPVQFSSSQQNPNIPSVIDISPEEVHGKMQHLCLIDVRRPEEYRGEYGHIPGARLLTLDTLGENLESLPRNETIVFICRSGGRSAKASALAQSKGFEHTFNMKGGMMAWTDLKYEADEKH